MPALMALRSSPYSRQGERCNAFPFMNHALTAYASAWMLRNFTDCESIAQHLLKLDASRQFCFMAQAVIQSQKLSQGACAVHESLHGLCHDDDIQD